MRPHGKVSFGGLVLLLAVVGGLWTLISIAPAYLDNLDVSEAVAAAANRARQGIDDDRLKREILEVTRRVGTHWGEDEDGIYRELPGLGLTEESITIERDYTTMSIVIRAEYQRFMQFKPLKQGVRLNLSSEKAGTFPR